MLARLVENKPIEALKVERCAAKEGIDISLFNLVLEVLVDNIHSKSMKLLLLRTINQLNQPKKFLDIFLRPVTDCQSLITEMIEHEKLQIS